MRPQALEGIDEARREERERELLRQYKTIFALPVSYEGDEGYPRIQDANGMLVADIRGYGRLISKVGETQANKIQDAFGKWLVNQINNEL